MKFAQRINGQEINLTQRITDQAKRMGSGVVNAAIGVPDAPVTPVLRRALRQVAAEPYSRYAPTAGLSALRSAIAAQRPRNKRPDNVLVTVGASEALLLVWLALVDPDDEVIIVTPAYFKYERLTKLCGAKAVFIPLRSVQGQWKLDVNEVRKNMSRRTAFVVINSPQNPTGWIADEKTTKALVHLCRKWNVPLVSDEVYKDYCLDGRSVSPERWYDGTIVVDSLSKSFSATGYRLGWIAAPKTFIQRVLSIHQLTVFSVPMPIQLAAVRALSQTASCITLKRKDQLRRRRDLAVRLLSRLPELEVVSPSGGLYLFVRLRDGRDGLKFCRRLLTKFQAAVVPGADYGPSGESSFRVVFDIAPKQMRLLVSRIQAALS